MENLRELSDHPSYKIQFALKLLNLLVDRLLDACHDKKNLPTPCNIKRSLPPLPRRKGDTKRESSIDMRTCGVQLGVVVMVVNW